MAGMGYPTQWTDRGNWTKPGAGELSDARRPNPGPVEVPIPSNDNEARPYEPPKPANDNERQPRQKLPPLPRLPRLPGAIGAILNAAQAAYALWRLFDAMANAGRIRFSSNYTNVCSAGGEFYSNAGPSTCGATYNFHSPANRQWPAQNLPLYQFWKKLTEMPSPPTTPGTWSGELIEKWVKGAGTGSHYVPHLPKPEDPEEIWLPGQWNPKPAKKPKPAPASDPQRPPAVVPTVFPQIAPEYAPAPGAPVPTPKPAPRWYVPNLPTHSPAGDPIRGPSDRPVTRPEPEPEDKPKPITRPVPKPLPMTPPATTPTQAKGPRPRWSQRPSVRTILQPGLKPRVEEAPHSMSPPPKGTRERKFAVTVGGRNAIIRAVNGATEACDFVDAIFEALPKEIQKKARREVLGQRALPWWKQKNKYGQTPWNKEGAAKPGLFDPKNMGCHHKAIAIYQNYNKVNMTNAIRNLAKEKLVDMAYGAQGKVAAQASRQAGLSKGLQLGPAL